MLRALSLRLFLPQGWAGKIFITGLPYNTPAMEKAIPQLPADDLTAAKAFYVDQLGFRVLFEVTKDGHSGLLGVARGGIEITLFSPLSRSGHGRDACVALQVEDTDLYYNEWSPKVRVLRAPKDEPWGARTFDLPDLFGNTIFVMGPVTGK